MDGNKIEITRPGADRRRAPRGPRPTERKHVRSFPLSLRRPSVSRTNVARARLTARRVQPSDDDVVVDETPTVGSVRAVDRRTPRGVSRACTVYAFSTSKDSKKLKFHFFSNGRRREPTDPPKVPDRSTFCFFRAECRPDDDCDAKCPPPPEKKTGFGIFIQSLASCERSKSIRVKSEKKEIFPPLGRCVKRGGR